MARRQGREEAIDQSRAEVMLRKTVLRVKKLEILGREALANGGAGSQDLETSLQNLVAGLQDISSQGAQDLPHLEEGPDGEIQRAPVRIVVADDHLALRDSIADRLEDETDLLVVGRASDCPSTLELIRNTSPDVVLIDIAMPGGTGVHVMRTAKQEAIGAKFLVLTMHRDRTMFEACMEAGASGFLTKATSPGDIVNAVREVADGGQTLNATLSSEGKATRSSQVASLLSARELSVLEHLARGYTSKEIAHALGLKAATVDTYRNRIVNKLGTRSRPDLVRIALDAGLLR